MKKYIILTLAIVFLTLVIVAFKSSDSEKKEYVTIYYTDASKEINISSSDGTYKTIECEKRKGAGDQTELLKTISLYNTQGYKISQYDFETAAGNSGYSHISVLMIK